MTINNYNFTEVFTLVYQKSLEFAIRTADNYDEGVDILHDVFERIIRNKDSDNHFESLEKFQGFIKTSIRNRFIDVKRKEERSPIDNFEEEVFNLMLLYSPGDIRTDQIFEDEYEDQIRAIDKTKFISARSFLSGEQYLVMTLRMNDYSFKDIASLMNLSINTILGQMRYGVRVIEKRFHESRKIEKRRKRFSTKTPHKGKSIKGLPPYQYFVIRLRELGLSMSKIAELEGVPINTIHYRWIWGKKNLALYCENEGDYHKIITHLDSLEVARKFYEKRMWLDAPKDKEIWVMEFIEKEGTIRPITLAKAYALHSGTAINRGSASKILKRLVKENKLESEDSNYKIRSSV